MLDKSLVTDVLTAAMSTGGDFAELFVEDSKKNGITMVNGIVEKSLSGIDYGAAIRVAVGYNAIYVYSNDTSREGLLKLAKEAAGALTDSRKAACLPFNILNNTNNHPIAVPFKDIPKKRIVGMMKEASDGAFAYNKLITQTTINYLDAVQDVLIANSDGLWAEDRRTRTRMTVGAVATLNDEKQDAAFGPGASKGFEFYDTLNMEEIGKNAAEIAVKMINAKYSPSGLMPVIIGDGFGGVIFHEACGHSLEATGVARGSSVFCGKMNQKIAADCVTAIDDGTIPGEWGSANIDDEGTPTRKNVLIENGILKSYLVDRLNGVRMGMPSTGSGRRESYRFSPTSRMTNTFIAPGNDDFDEMFSGVDYGLYAKKMGGGSVNPGTGEFNFAVTEAYMIRNGKIAEPVRGASLIGKGHEVLFNIDRVGKTLRQEQGMCGSISGSIPTNVGQPPIRVKEILVGGRA